MHQGNGGGFNHFYSILLTLSRFAIFIIVAVYIGKKKSKFLKSLRFSDVDLKLLLERLRDKGKVTVVAESDETSTYSILMHGFILPNR